ncbi:MAG: AAA family ATPase, partial [Phycisphaerales bacterium]|nr:AAA family ATPase [Phycisphaerales bacterium]
MSTTHALFYRVDHRNVVVESWCKPVTLPRNGNADIGQILRNASADIPSEDGLAFAGILSGRSRLQLSVSDIYDLVCNSDDGALSNHYCRFARVSSASGKPRASRKRAMVQGRLASFGAKAWYDDQARVPKRLRDKFVEHTLVYLDRRDRSIEVMPVFLFRELESSIVDMVAAHEWWEPITLFEGGMRLESAGLAFRSDHRPSEPPFYPSENGHLPPAAFDDDLDKDESDSTAEDADAELNEPAVAPKKMKSVADVLCEGLVEETIVRFMEGRPSHPEEALRGFRDIYLSKRPLILLETVHWELGPNIAKFMAEIGGLRYRAEGRYGDYGSYQNGGMMDRDSGSVVLFSRRSFEGGGQDAAKEIDNRIRALLAAGDIGLVVTDNIMSLPAPLRLNRDLELELPELVGHVRDRVFTEIFGPGAVPGPDGDLWTRYASALDLEKVYHAGARGVAAVQDLSERVQGRLTRMGATKGPALNQIHGLGEAKEHANAFIGDIKAYLAGSIPWSQVDRGMLLVGPPGTGKTMMARAMSREAGIRFIHASASDWQSANHLGEHVQAIRGSFAMARRYAPSIIFIDEFDSIGRRGFGGHNEFYHTAVVNAVLEELQGFQDREGVIVMAATN